jgi:hypothetical protein
MSAPADRPGRPPAASPSPGYSGTPLAAKLGLTAGQRVLLGDAPARYADWIAPAPPGLVFVDRPDATVDLAHVFVTRRDTLAAALGALRQALRDDAVVWVSWPKKAAKVATDVTEDTIRELALPLGFVDVKVCAVNETWSGLKLMVRRRERKLPQAAERSRP